MTRTAFHTFFLRQHPLYTTI